MISSVFHSSAHHFGHRASRLIRWSLASAACWALLGTAPLARAHGEYHEVIDDTTQELLRDPVNAELHFRLAGAYCDHGDWELALERVKLVEQLAPGRFGVELVRGHALLLAGRGAEARDMLDRFLDTQGRLELTTIEARHYRAQANRLLGDMEACLADYRILLERWASPNPEVVLEAVEVLVQQKQAAEAMQWLEAALVKTGPEPSLVLRLLDLELAAGKTEAALTRVEAMQRSAPRPERWMARRAEILTQAKRRTEAGPAWKELQEHIEALPSLVRGQPDMIRLLNQARSALGQPTAQPVAAPPTGPARVSTVTFPPAKSKPTLSKP